MRATEAMIHTIKTQINAKKGNFRKCKGAFAKYAYVLYATRKPSRPVKVRTGRFLPGFSYKKRMYIVLPCWYNDQRHKIRVGDQASAQSEK